MAVLALAFWSVTALAGLFVLAIWLIEYDPGFQYATASRLPVLVVTGYVLFAVAGLMSWVACLITCKHIYSRARARWQPSPRWVHHGHRLERGLPRLAANLRRCRPDAMRVRGRARSPRGRR